MAFDGPHQQDVKIEIREVRVYEIYQRGPDGWVQVAHTTDRAKAEAMTGLTCHPVTE